MGVMTMFLAVMKLCSTSSALYRIQTPRSKWQPRRNLFWSIAIQSKMMIVIAMIEWLVWTDYVVSMTNNWIVHIVIMIEDQWQSAAGHRYPVIGSETKEVMYVVDKYCCYLIRVVREIYRWKIPNFLQYQPFFLLRINAFCVLIISVIFFLGGGPTAICYKTNRVIVTGKKCIYPRKQKYNN